MRVKSPLGKNMSATAWMMPRIISTTVTGFDAKIIAKERVRSSIHLNAMKTKRPTMRKTPMTT